MSSLVTRTLKFLRSKARPLLAIAVGVFIFLEIIILSPSTLEKKTDENTQVYIDPKVLIQQANSITEKALAPGIPSDRVPEYSIQKFEYISATGNTRQWKLIAKTANLYNEEKLVHGRQITAYLFNPDDEPTLVVGNEAKYFMNARDLEVFGEVRALFPDGFVIESEYMRYKPDQRIIHIPKKYFVKGTDPTEKEKRIHFTSNGLDFAMDRDHVILPSNVRFTMERVGPRNEYSGGVADSTTILSDHCRIDRSKNIAHFTMYAGRPLEERFVRVRQPDLRVRSRKVDLNYGEYIDVVEYMIARDDVYIREIDPEKKSHREKSDPLSTIALASENPLDELRYGTCGQADFNTQKNIIVLTKFPQVYQNSDTVTGDVIIIHRDQDLVEVKHSNAFSRGQPEEKPERLERPERKEGDSP